MDTKEIYEMYDIFENYIDNLSNKSANGYVIGEIEWNAVKHVAEIMKNNMTALGNSHDKLQELLREFYTRDIALDRERFLARHEYSDDPDIMETVEYVRKKGKMEMINYPFVEKYDDFDCPIYDDPETEMRYIEFANKRMYLKSDLENPLDYVKSIVVEQDEMSPHRYFDDIMCVNEGDIVIDAGVAEGNFSLEIVEKAKKIYLVECDPEWVKAIRLTFKEYMDKIVIVDKFLDEYDDDTHITIDTMVGDGEKINYLKMDIEGAEQAALKGGYKTIKRSDNLKCSICTYHSHTADEEIHKLLEDYDFQLHYSRGYFVYRDLYFLIHYDLRKVLLHGIKNK